MKFLNRILGNKETALFASLLVLAFAGFKFLHGIGDFYPLERYEGFFINMGNNRTAFFPMIEAWPYERFLRFLGYFQKDPIELFYLNASLQSIALAFCGFITVRRMGVNNFFSLLLGFFVLISIINAPVFPKINHFNISCYLLVMFFSTFFRSELLSLASLTLFSLFSVYIRPDNIFIFIPLALYFLWLCLRNKIKYALCLFASLILIFIGWTMFLGSPFGRGWDTFADHFYWKNLYRYYPSDVKMLRLDFIKNIFGTAHSIPQAFFANPQAVLLHMWENVFRLAQFFPSWMCAHFPLSGDKLGNFTKASYWELLLFCLFLLIMKVYSYFFSRRESESRVPYGANSAYTKTVFLMSFIFLFRMLMTNLLFSPRDRYGIEFVVLLLIVVTFGISRTIKIANETVCLIGLFLVIAFYCPTHSHNELKSEITKPDDFMIGNIAFSIRKLDPSRRLKLLSDIAIATFSGKSNFEDPLHYREVQRRYKSFGEYLVVNNFGIVVMDEYTNRLLREDSGPGAAEDFKNTAGNYGFTPVIVFSQKPDTRLYMKDRIN